MKRFSVLITALLILGSIAVSQNAPRPILIKNATIVPVEGETIPNGSLLIQGSKIAAIGANVTAPTEARVIDAQGMYVYPGFIDGFSHLGLTEIGAIASTVDTREMGKENPEVKVAWAINPYSVHFKTSRICGTTAALVAPAGGTFPGISALVKMDGWTIEEMAVNEEVASLINFPMTPRPTRGARIGPRRESQLDVTEILIEKIKEFLNEVRRYRELKEVAAEDPKVSPPDLNAKYEALIPVLAGRLPVILSVEKDKDIEAAIKFVQEENIKAIFHGCAQGFKVADKIAAAGIPVIIPDLYMGPVEPEDGYDAPFRNVVELAQAGVILCFSSGTDPATGKDLPYHAARAVAFGLDHDEAIKALTINPARVFGLEERVGSLKVGKDADLFITTGDPLDLRSEVKHLFINGRDVDLSNWWEALYQHSKSRPMKK